MTNKRMWWLKQRQVSSSIGFSRRSSSFHLFKSRWTLCIHILWVFFSWTSLHADYFSTVCSYWDKKEKIYYLVCRGQALIRAMWSYDIPFSVAWNGCGLDWLWMWTWLFFTLEKSAGNDFIRRLLIRGSNAVQCNPLQKKCSLVLKAIAYKLFYHK